MVSGHVLLQRPGVPSPLTGMQVTSTGPVVDGAVHFQPAGVSETTATSAGTLIVTVPVADWDPPPLFTTNGTTPTRPSCNGR